MGTWLPTPFYFSLVPLDTHTYNLSRAKASTAPNRARKRLCVNPANWDGSTEGDKLRLWQRGQNSNLILPTVQCGVQRQFRDAAQVRTQRLPVVNLVTVLVVHLLAVLLMCTCLFLIFSWVKRVFWLLFTPLVWLIKLTILLFWLFKTLLVLSWSLKRAIMLFWPVKEIRLLFLRAERMMIQFLPDLR